MMTSDEIGQAIETAHVASFLADEPAPLEAALPGAPIALEVEV
jgi:hypothetical protein